MVSVDFQIVNVVIGSYVADYGAFSTLRNAVVTCLKGDKTVWRFGEAGGDCPDDSPDDQLINRCLITADVGGKIMREWQPEYLLCAVATVSG